MKLYIGERKPSRKIRNTRTENNNKCIQQLTGEFCYQ
nr:MAG TPA: hypothetical protein [Caudoviricetes sp.]